MTKKIFVVAGEHSGDVLGAGLMEALKAQSSEAIEFSGIGGPNMEAEGLKSLLPMDELCVMGIWEIIGHLPRLLKLVKGVAEEIEKYNPDVVVTIDLPDFNFAVASQLKKNGKSKAKIVHYVAPTVWAWRPGRAKKIAQFLDGLMCLFPFEPSYFTKHNLKAEFVGHPLIEFDPADADPVTFRQQRNIPADAPILGLFFGSRQSEIESMSKILKESALLVHEQYPDLHVVVPTVPNLEYEVRKVLEDVDYSVFVVTDPDQKWDAFAACNVAAAVSGTVGLELAYMGVPHVIAYKAHPVTWLALRALVKVKYAHLANILLDAPVIPEFLQNQCKSFEIGKAIYALFKFEDRRKLQLEKTASIREKLGVGEGSMPSQRAAEFVLKML